MSKSSSEGDKDGNYLFKAAFYTVLIYGAHFYLTGICLSFHANIIFIFVWRMNTLKTSKENESFEIGSISLCAFELKMKRKSDGRKEYHVTESGALSKNVFAF